MVLPNLASTAKGWQKSVFFFITRIFYNRIVKMAEPYKTKGAYLFVQMNEHAVEVNLV